jgi:hypothetical protein
MPRYAIAGALLAIGLIVLAVATTPGLPTWAGAVAGAVILIYIAWSTWRTARVATRVLDVMRGKGPMTITDMRAALGDAVPKRAALIGALIRLRTRGAVTRDEIPPALRGDAPDTHRYTAA